MAGHSIAPPRRRCASCVGNRCNKLSLARPNEHASRFGNMFSTAASRRAVIAGLLTFAGALRADLAEYLAKPDPSYSWKLTGKSDAAGATLYELWLISAELRRM